MSLQNQGVLALKTSKRDRHIVTAPPSFICSVRLETARFQLQSASLLQPEHQVEVLDSLTGSALQQVIDHGDDQQLIAMLLDVDDTLVRVHHLLQVRVSVHHEGEGRILVEILVELLDFLDLQVALRIGRDEDAPREITAHRQEIDIVVEARLQLTHGAVDLQQVLVRESLVDGDVVVSPAEVGRCARLYTRTRGTRDASGVHLALQQTLSRQREKTDLDGRGETTRVRQLSGLLDALTVHLRQAIDESVALVAVILREVDDLHVGRHHMRLQELPAIPMTRADEQGVHLIQRELVGEGHLRLAEKTLMDVIEFITRITATVNEDHLHLRMVQNDAKQLACRIAGTAYNSYFYHNQSQKTLREVRDIF